jgi:hypothetical protein
MASQQNKRAKGLLGAIGAVKLLAFDAIEKLSGTHFTVKGTFWPDLPSKARCSYRLFVFKFVHRVPLTHHDKLELQINRPTDSLAFLF